MFGIRNKGKEEPYEWKKYQSRRGTHTEYRYFHGRTREWGRVSVSEDGQVSWRYLKLPPLGALISIDGNGTQVTWDDERMPFWFMENVHEAIRMQAQANPTNSTERKA